MSKDIRSFFTVGAKKKPALESPSQPSPQKKRKASVISSDEENGPTTSKESLKKRKTTTNGVDKKPDLSKLAKKLVSKDTSMMMDNDDDLEKSLMEIDESTLSPSKKNKKTPGKTPQSEKKSKKELNESLIEIDESTPSPSKKDKKTSGKTPKSKKDSNESLIEIDESTPSPSKKDKKTSGKTPKSEKKQKKDLNESVLSDEERFERKRMAAMMYQKFKNRPTGALNPGSKEIPKGKPNCLAGSTFLITGLLDSIERDEGNQIIKDLGGKVSTVVGKKLNYLIAGQDSGLKKIATADELGIKVLTEDEFFDLIRVKSGEKPLSKNNNDSPESKDKKLSPKKEKKSPKKVKNAESPSKKPMKTEESVVVKKEVKQEEVESVHNKESTEIKLSKTEEPVVGEKQEEEENVESLAWVDKYKPTEIKQIIGQQGAASNCTKLINWLKNWYSNHDGKKKLQRPNPWAKNDDGSFYRCALLSGPPGVGKTTTATLVCKELGFDTVEFNASDTRSKKLLKEEVSELLSNKSLYGYFHGEQVVSKKHVLLMDEVDGMAGNEDRGGIQELISLIKDSSVPIICMCNDRNHQKMRSLVNYCYDLRFSKPQINQIKGAIMSICFKEKFKLPPSKIEEIILATNNDIRQTLNHLSLLSAGKDLELKTKPTDEKTAEKDLKLGPWEVVRKVFTAEEHEKMSFNDKCDLFFNDYSMAPLFVQQNYLQVAPKASKDQIPERIAKTADALSLGDLVEKRIRSNMAWSLLPTQAIFSSVMPGEYMSGKFTGQINFPGWLGKNSQSSKRKRMAQEIHDHTRINTSGSRLSIRLDYAPFLLNAIVNPLKKHGIDGIEEALNVIKAYRLLREDIDSLIELTTWIGKKNAWESIDGKVKAALTRAYNKEVMAYTYSAVSGVKRKATAAADDNLGIDGEDDDGVANISDDENDEKVENDTLIKAKKQTKKASSDDKKKAPAKRKAASKSK